MTKTTIDSANDLFSSIATSTEASSRSESEHDESQFGQQSKFRLLTRSQSCPELHANRRALSESLHQVFNTKCSTNGDERGLTDRRLSFFGKDSWSCQTSKPDHVQGLLFTVKPRRPGADDALAFERGQSSPEETVAINNGRTQNESQCVNELELGQSIESLLGFECGETSSEAPPPEDKTTIHEHEDEPLWLSEGFNMCFHQGSTSAENQQEAFEVNQAMLRPKVIESIITNKVKEIRDLMDKLKKDEWTYEAMTHSIRCLDKAFYQYEESEISQKIKSTQALVISNEERIRKLESQLKRLQHHKTAQAVPDHWDVGSDLSWALSQTLSQSTETELPANEIMSNTIELSKSLGNESSHQVYQEKLSQVCLTDKASDHTSSQTEVSDKIVDEWHRLETEWIVISREQQSQWAKVQIVANQLSDRQCKDKENSAHVLFYVQLMNRWVESSNTIEILEMQIKELSWSGRVMAAISKRVKEPSWSGRMMTAIGKRVKGGESFFIADQQSQTRERELSL